MSATFVYFIKPIGKAGPIKIGWSQSPVDRLQTMMAWSPFPLEIVITLPGTYELEQNLHQCFSDCHKHGEWFDAAPRLVAAISALRAGRPLHEAVDLSDRRGPLVRGPVGGAGWPEATRRYMSMYMRIVWARKLVGGDRRCAPVDVDELMDAVRNGHILSRDEAARFEAVVADPASHFLTHEERYPRELSQSQSSNGTAA